MQTVTEIGETQQESSSWSQVALLAPVFALFLAALYSSIGRALVAQWWDDANYAHGFLVPLFSGFLVWRQRAASICW